MAQRGAGWPGRDRRTARSGDQGAVTVELALGLPLLLAVTLGLIWLLAVGAAQIQVIDASREAARAIARGDDQTAAVAVAERIAPPGASVSIDRAEGHVEVSTRARIRGPGGLFSHLPAVQVHADAVALVEE